MHPSSSLSPLLFSIPLASAICANVTQVRTVQDGFSGGGFSTSGTITLDSVYCPPNNNSGCVIPRKSYPNITFGRTMNISTSAESAEDIYAAAHQWWQDRADNLNYASNATHLIIPQFLNRTVTISTISSTLQCRAPETSLGCLSQSSTLLDIDPGKTTNLLYTPFQYYTFLRLENCTNSTLNGVSVSLAVPQWNETVSFVPGTYGASSAQGDTSDGSWVRGRASWLAAVVAVGVATLGMV